MVDIDTGKITPLPPSIATSGTYYAVSPDHTQVAFNACCAQPGPVRLANIDGTQVQQVTAKGWDAYGAQWSPDGYHIVYQQRHASTGALGNLFVLNVSTGRSTQITNFDQTKQWDWWFTFPSFSSDGRSIVFQLPRGDNTNPVWDLWTVSGGGKPSLLVRNAGWGGLAYGRTSPRVAYLSPVSAADFSGGGLWLMSLDQRLHPRAMVQNGQLGWLRWSPDLARISYSNGGSIYVVDVATGSVTKVAEGGHAEWFDDHTLIVGNPTN